MTLPASGSISASQINVELNRAANAPFSIDSNITLNSARYLAERFGSNEPICFSDFHGKKGVLVY